MARFVMNTSILPNDGIFSLATISEDEAKRWVARKDWVSAVGHPGTAELAEIANKVKDSRELIDYWAIDWDYKGDTFHNQWQSFRRSNKYHTLFGLESSGT